MGDSEQSVTDTYADAEITQAIMDSLQRSEESIRQIHATLNRIEGNLQSMEDRLDGMITTTERFSVFAMVSVMLVLMLVLSGCVLLILEWS